MQNNNKDINENKEKNQRKECNKMEEKRQYYIYKITNSINNKSYINITISLKKQKSDQFLKLKRQKHKNKELQEDYNLYGQDVFTFEIIDNIYDTKDNAENLKENIIEEYKKIGKIYNIDINLNKMNKHQYYIFKMTNIKNNKIYIGITENPTEREKTLFQDLNRQKYTKWNIALQEDYNSHGNAVFTFEIIDNIYDTKTEATRLKGKIVREYNKTNKIYNVDVKLDKNEPDENGNRNYYIYRITNIKNNKVYIGVTADPKVRKRDHFKDLNRQEHGNKYLQEDYNLYGKNVFIFEVINTIFSKEKDATDLEEKITREYEKIGQIYNINYGTKLGEELIIQRKITASKQGKGKDNHNYKQFTEEQKKELLQMYLDGVYMKDIAKYFNCGEKTIYLRMKEYHSIYISNRKYKKFTEEQKQELIQMYGDGILMKDIAEHFNCSNNYILNKIKEYNIYIPDRNPDCNKKQFTEKQIQEMIKMYKNGICIKDIAVHFNCSSIVISNRLKENNITHEQFAEDLINKQMPEIIQMYKNGISLKDIAKRFNCGIKTIHNRIQDLGIYDPTRNYKSITLLQQKDEIIKLYSEFISLQKIAEKFDTNKAIIAKILKQSGIKLRTPSETKRAKQNLKKDKKD